MTTSSQRSVGASEHVAGPRDPHDVTMTVPNRALPPEQEAEAIAAYENGATARALGVKYGRSASAMHSLFRRKGVKGGKWKATKFNDPTFLTMRREGKTVAEIAAAFGVPHKTAEWWVQKAIRAKLIDTKPTGFGGDPWTDEETARLKTLWETMGPAQIARVTGWTVSRITGRAARLKLPGKGYPAVRVDGPRKPRTPKPPKLTAAQAKAIRDAERQAAIEARKAQAAVMWTPGAGSRPFLERGVGQCAWPLGEGGQIMSCCAPTEGRDTYCPQHRQLAGGRRVDTGYSKAPTYMRRGPGSVFDRGRSLS